MPRSFIIAIMLGSAVPVAPMMLAAVERASAAQPECSERRKTATVPVRLKKEQSRKRCQVVAPILM